MTDVRYSERQTTTTASDVCRNNVVVVPLVDLFLRMSALVSIFYYDHN